MIIIHICSTWFLDIVISTCYGLATLCERIFVQLTFTATIWEELIDTAMYSTGQLQLHICVIPHA